MRFNINLATHPHEDASAFYRRWGTGLAVLALATAALIAVAVHEWMSTRSITRQIAGIQKEMDQLDDTKNRALAILNRPEHQGTRRRSEFVNELIEFKSFSWNQVLADMERLMPTRVQLVSIKPELDKQHDIQVTITAASDSTGKGVELLQNIEKSRYFREPRLRQISEQGQSGPQPQPQTAAPAKFELHVQYVPQPRVPEKKKGSQGGPVVGKQKTLNGRAIASVANRGRQ